MDTDNIKCAFCKTVAGLKCLIVLGLIHLIFFSFDSPPRWTVFISLGLTHNIKFPGIPFDKKKFILLVGLRLAL